LLDLFVVQVECRCSVWEDCVPDQYAQMLIIA
jgi:hypothetical protein